jgi:hypothetical protein
MLCVQVLLLDWLISIGIVTVFASGYHLVWLLAFAEYPSLLFTRC